MPRRDDDEPDDDDRPRRRPRDEDEDQDRPARSRRQPRDDEEGERPAGKRRGRPADEDEDDLAPPRKKKSSLGLILGILGGILLLCCGGGGVVAWWLYKKAEGTTERLTTNNDLRQMGLGFHNYHSVYGGFPTNSYTPDGKPLLSWRVHLLPYVEQDALYRQFKLNEPWDSPNNRRLLDQMPSLYATPAERTGKVAKGNRTYFRGFSNPGAVFEKKPGAGAGGQPPRGVGLGMVTDTPFNTILVVEAGDAVEWTKPDDLDAAPGKPFPALGGIRPKDDTVLVLFADGTVRAVKKSTPESTWRAGATYAGNDPANFD